MSNAITAGAVLYAKDIVRVSRFYAGIVGLAITHEEVAHMVLESAGFQLVVVAIPRRLANQIEVASPPVRRENSAIKLCFFVPSIADARLRISDLGGELNALEREWNFDGAKVCDGCDPEGNVFQLRERVT